MKAATKTKEKWTKFVQRELPFAFLSSILRVAIGIEQTAYPVCLHAITLIWPHIYYCITLIAPTCVSRVEFNMHRVYVVSHRLFFPFLYHIGSPKIYTELNESEVIIESIKKRVCSSYTVLHGVAFEPSLPKIKLWRLKQSDTINYRYKTIWKRRGMRESLHSFPSVITRKQPNYKCSTRVKGDPRISPPSIRDRDTVPEWFIFYATSTRLKRHASSSNNLSHS